MKPIVASPRPAIAVFSTMGRGSRDDDRIIGLTAELAPAIWSFDPAFKRRSAIALLRRLRRDRPDLVVVEGTSIAAGAALLLGRWLFKVPYVVSSGDAVGPFVGLISRKLVVFGYLYEYLLCRFCAGFIGWSPYLVGRALTLGAPRAMTAANWAPPHVDHAGARQTVRQELGIPSAAVVFGLAGSLNWSDRAGYCYGLELVRAIARTQRGDVHVLVLGDGSGRGRLEAEAGGSLGVRVHLPGRVDREDVGRYLAAMDVASLPQSVDGVGSFRYTTKLSEYIAAGLPIVTGQTPLAYDLGGDWIWRLPGGAPWSNRYIDALADLMEQLDDQTLQAGRASVPADLPDFDEQRQRCRTSSFLRDLLERPDRGLPARGAAQTTSQPARRHRRQAND